MESNKRQQLKEYTDKELQNHINKYTKLLKDAEKEMQSDELGKLQLAYNKLSYARKNITAAIKEQVRRARHQ